MVILPYSYYPSPADEVFEAGFLLIAISLIYHVPILELVCKIRVKCGRLQLKVSVVLSLQKYSPWRVTFKKMFIAKEVL